MTPKRKLTDRAVKALAYDTLNDEGLLLPKTPEQVEQLEEQIQALPPAQMNADIALEIASKLSTPEGSGLTFESGLSETDRVVAEQLALAARNGGTIPAEMWEKMRAARENAEYERRRKRRQ